MMGPMMYMDGPMDGRPKMGPMMYRAILADDVKLNAAMKPMFLGQKCDLLS